MPSLFEARCRLLTSANCVYFDVRARTTTLVPRWDGGLDHLPVLTRKRPLPCGSGSERRAVLRPITTTPLPVPPTCVGLPDLDTAATAPPPNELPRRCVVTIDVHGSEDREKDFAYRGASGVFAIALASGACALKGRTRTRFPSSASSGHPLSPVLAPTREDPPADDVDRPRPVFHRPPAKGTGFPQAGMPSTATLRPLSTRLLPPEVRRRPPAHAAQHVFPRLGKGA
jgi:hypothetical protein